MAGRRCISGEPGVEQAVLCRIGDFRPFPPAVFGGGSSDTGKPGDLPVLRWAGMYTRLTYRPKTGLPPSGRSHPVTEATASIVDRPRKQRAAMVIATADQRAALANTVVMSVDLCRRRRKLVVPACRSDQRGPLWWRSSRAASTLVTDVVVIVRSVAPSRGLRSPELTDQWSDIAR